MRSERCPLARTPQLAFRSSNQPREVFDLESSIIVPLTRLCYLIFICVMCDVHKGHGQPFLLLSF